MPEPADPRHPNRTQLVVASVVLVVVVSLVVVAVALGNEPDHAGGTAPTAAPPPTQAPTSEEPPTPVPEATNPDGTVREGPASWQEDLRTLRIAEPAGRDGYDRALFDHWIDVDANSCNTRCEVLLRELRHDLAEAPVGGWLSVYDGVVTAESSELDVDHTVALSEAWVSGAYTWDESRRRDFANDLTGGSLRAVTASVNRSKGDRDPAEWQPPLRSSWCGYAADWIRVKNRWGLSADPLEFTVLSEMLQGCP